MQRTLLHDCPLQRDRTFPGLYFIPKAFFSVDIMPYFRCKSFLPVSLLKIHGLTAEDVGSACDHRYNAEVKDELLHAHALIATWLCEHMFKN